MRWLPFVHRSSSAFSEPPRESTLVLPVEEFLHQALLDTGIWTIGLRAFPIPSMMVLSAIRSTGPKTKSNLPRCWKESDVEAPSEYEKIAHHQIHAWKNPEQSWFDTVMKVVSWPLDNGAQALLNTPGIGPAIQAAFSGIVGVVNDAAQWSVRPQSILEEYRRFGHTDVMALSDVYRLDLLAVDRAIGWLDTKYEGMALAQGAAAGGTSVLTPMAALAIIPTDVCALLALNLRAVGEYASYCGFDVSLPQERLFALNVLALASSPTDTAKQVALAQLVRIARDVALGESWQTLETHVAVQAAQSIAKSLSIRLTKAKLAQVIPVAGAVIGGGFNAYYTDKVCKAAFYLYRERFLAEKYGADEIEVTVEPAPTLLPTYETEP